MANEREEGGESGSDEARVTFLRRILEEPRELEVISGVANLVADVDLDLCVESDEDF
jgi:hypothetical protein